MTNVRASTDAGHQKDDLQTVKTLTEAYEKMTDQLAAANDALKAANKPEIKVLTFDQNPLAVEQLRAGRADAVIADSPVVANDARLSEGKLEALGLTIEAAPYGIGLRKDSTELNAAVKAALDEIISNGKYAEILKKWGLEGGAIE